jgi:hypothetical protein
MAGQMLVLNAIVSVPLAQHKIDIPNGFENKIAREIRIEINARMQMKFANELPDIN